MAVLIKGVTVTLYERTQTGEDDFGAAVYSEQPVEVDNVLITPVSTSSVTDDVQLHGKRGEYELHIPKTDAHTWTDCSVEFYGVRWRVIGLPQQFPAASVPLDWDRKVKVERYE